MTRADRNRLAFIFLLTGVWPMKTQLVVSQQVPLDKATLQGNELIQTPIGNIELVHNYFNSDISEKLYDELRLSSAML